MTLLRRRPSVDRRGWTTPPKPIFGRRGITALLLITLLGGAFVSMPPPKVSADALSDALAQQEALQAQIARQKAQISALAASQTKLSSQLASTKATLASVNADLLSVKSQIVDMTVEVANAQGSVDELVATVALLDTQLADVEAKERAKQDELAARKAVLAERIRTAYDGDRTSLLETLLSGDNFTDVLSEVDYHLDLASQDQALAQQIVDDQKLLGVIHQTVIVTRDQTESLRTEAASRKADLDTQLEDLAAAKAELAKLEAQTRQLLADQQAQYAKLAADKTALSKSLADAKAAQDALEAQIRELVRQQYASGGIPSEYSGSLIWPMPGVVTQEFGCTGFSWEPPLGSCSHFHAAIDIANSMYTPIRAAAPGKVVWAGKSPYDPSWVVIIAHSSQLVTWYAHIDNYSHPPAVSAGEYVAQGQIIAYEGMTGWTTGPHLHWGVQLNGVWVNPRLFL
ncbi:MAG: murein hydrolase activator EnvC [Chloroflexota bacterium]